MALKDRIKEARQNNSLTQEQLANKLGIAKSTLAGYETGNREPGVGMVAKIMHVLNVDANYLWQDETDFPMQVSYDEMKHIEKYRELDNHGKEMVDIVLSKEYDRCISFEDNVLDLHSHILADAAHSRTDIDIEEGTDLNEDNIMDEKDF